MLDRLAESGLVEREVPLARLTTYKLGGPARWFAQVDVRETLDEIASAWRSDEVPVFVVGRGSNVVVGERGFPGLVIRLGGEFAHIEHHPDRITAGAAVPLPLLARSAVRLGRLGLEFFVGIPGSVGGAVRQNAGCHGVETVDRLVGAEVLDMSTLELGERTGSELELSYRHSNLAAHHLVLGAFFSFEEGDPADGERTMREITRWRKENQPGGTLNAGSVFKNPPGDAAGRIIDDLGLKGLRIGGASVSERHANFFVAAPDATPSDVLGLVEEVRSRVEVETGVMLEPEIQFIGEFSRGGDG